MAATCPHCGVTLPATVDAFCPQCRRPLDEEPVRTVPRDGVSRGPATDLGWTRKCAAIGVILGLLAGLGRLTQMPGVEPGRAIGNVCGTMFATVVILGGIGRIIDAVRQPAGKRDGKPD